MSQEPNGEQAALPGRTSTGAPMEASVVVLVCAGCGRQHRRRMLRLEIIDPNHKCFDCMYPEASDRFNYVREVVLNPDGD